MSTTSPRRPSTAGQNLSIFERLSSGGTSTRSGRGAPGPTSPKSLTSSTRSTTSPAAAKTTRAGTAATTTAKSPAAKPAAKEPVAKSPLQRAARSPLQSAAKSPVVAPADKAASPAASAGSFRKEPSSASPKRDSLSASGRRPSESSPTDPKDPSLRRSPQVTSEKSSGAFHEPTAPPPPPPPPPALTAEQEAEIKDLGELRDAKKAELAAIERELQIYALRFKATNSRERAEHFAKRTEETMAENKVMRKEIELLRNSDRVMVSLRDTLETMKKHQRIRTAHIRQKEATIELIARRCREQREERVRMLGELEKDCDALDTLAKEETQLEGLVAGIKPLRCMAFALRYDGQDEEHIEAITRSYQELRTQDDQAARRVSEQLATLSAGIDTETGFKTATMDGIAAEWEETKLHMLAELQRLNKLHGEYDYHVRRGTNIKSVAVLPDALTVEERMLRDALLNLGQEEERLLAAKKRHAAKKAAEHAFPVAHELAESERRREATMAANLAHELAAANAEWRARFAELQQVFTGGALAASESFFADASMSVRMDQSTAYDHATPDRRPEVPRAFTPKSAQRLFSAKTRSRKVAEEATLDENYDRARRAASMRKRARGAPPPKL
jgi:hypothetical protein